MLERETAREKNLEKAQKEAKIRARKDAVAQEPAAAAAAIGEGDNIQQVIGHCANLIGHCFCSVDLPYMMLGHH
jgi:hypothetical protein